MLNILRACTISLLIYAVSFAYVLDRPLTLGALRARIEATVAAGAAIQEPKLVILAGSNAPYSHRCETIGPVLARPCVNGGIAVGVGLDYLFARWKPALHPGDIVYLPLEEVQYARTLATSDLGPDAAIMLRHDRATFWAMPLRRQLAALFDCDLRAAIMSLIETALAGDGFHDPRIAAEGGFNRWGDHVGHTAVLAAANQSALAAIHPFHPTSEQIASGYGSVIIAEFLDWARAHAVEVIGGPPTGFADSPIGPAELAAIHAIFQTHATRFLDLPNMARYPRSDFFDSQDHLNETAQITHSLKVAKALATVTPWKLDFLP